MFTDAASRPPLLSGEEDVYKRQDESLTQLMEMLENGEVDLMGGMLYSASMAELYDYSGYSYGVVETVLQVLQEDTRDLVVDSQTQQTFRVAVPSSSKQRLKELQEYCDMNLIELVPVLCADKAEQLQALSLIHI